MEFNFDNPLGCIMSLVMNFIFAFSGIVTLVGFAERNSRDSREKNSRLDKRSLARLVLKKSLIFFLMFSLVYSLLFLQTIYKIYDIVNMGNMDWKSMTNTPVVNDFGFTSCFYLAFFLLMLANVLMEIKDAGQPDKNIEISEKERKKKAILCAMFTIIVSIPLWFFAFKLLEARLG